MNLGFLIRIVILGSNKKFKFKCKDLENLKQWIFSIQLNISSSEAYKKPNVLISMQPRFWKYLRILEKNFRECANTGDIILFKSRNPRSIFVRAITSSEYDHIGMILRFADKKIGLLESTGSEVI